MADVFYRLPHIKQSGSQGCWAASAAMILGRSVTQGSAAVTPETMVDLGGGLRLPAPGGGLAIDENNINNFAESAGLKLLPESAQTNSVETIARLLDKGGPIIAGGKYRTEKGSFNHAVVISGVRGNQVYALDPGQRGRAGWMNYNEWLRQQPYATAIMLQPKAPCAAAQRERFNWKSNAIPPDWLRDTYRPDLPGQAGWGLQVTRSRPGAARPPTLQWLGQALEPPRSRPDPPRPGSLRWMAQGLDRPEPFPLNRSEPFRRMLGAAAPGYEVDGHRGLHLQPLAPPPGSLRWMAQGLG